MTKLIFRYEHLTLYHAGPQALLAAVREKYWPVSGRNLAKGTVRECVICFRHNATIQNPIMGELPATRVYPGFPFEVTGVDYAGPYLIKNQRGRGARISKCWLCLFVCMKTRAVHIEIVTTLSTDSFMMAFRRFVARRGRPTHVYSDNGTNFVGAYTKLGTFFKGENAVKSCKHHLRRVMGNISFTYEELYTLVVQIESILNSRPLHPLSSDPNDYSPLTPAHFLLGRPVTRLPDPDVTGCDINRLTRFQLIQNIQQHFWQRWQKEYISELQQRCKWKQTQADLKLNDLVLIKEDNMPPKLWKLGRICKVYPGRDGVCRVADVKTASGIIRRAFSKLCVLPVARDK